MYSYWKFWKSRWLFTYYLNRVSIFESCRDGLQNNSKSNERRMFTQNCQDIWIFYLNLELEQALFMLKNSTAWKLSTFSVFLVRIFTHSDWIRRDTDFFTQSSLIELPQISLIIWAGSYLYGRRYLLTQS